MTNDPRQTDFFKPTEYAPTSPTETVVFVYTDNAIAMYLRGKLVKDGVFLNREMVLDALGISHATFEADELWWSEQAGALFPSNLSEVKTAKEE